MQQQPTPPESSSEEASGLTLAQEVDKLMKLPQHLCKQRGLCCKVAVFKGLASHTSLLEQASIAGEEGEMARDFASIFVPHEDINVVKALTPDFVETVYEIARKRGDNPEEVTFYACKNLLPSGRCGVHEDRPTGCRSYPIPHTRSVFHKGCGYEQQAKENWQHIMAILEAVGLADNYR